MLIDRKKLATDRDTLNWLVICGLAEAFKDDAFADFTKNWRDKDKVNIQFLVEGQEIDVEILCQRWQEEVERMINKRAVELLGEKFSNISEFIYNIEKEVATQVREKLGMEPSEYDY